MGQSKRLFADAAGPAGDDVGQSTKHQRDTRPGPIHGFAIRHGQTVPFTLDTSQPIPAPPVVMPEQIAIAALVLASFVGAIFHLMG